MKTQNGYLLLPKMNYNGMNEFDVAYYRCMMALGEKFGVGDYNRIYKDSGKRGEIQGFEKELDKLWCNDYVVFRAVLVAYYKFMKEAIKLS